MSRRILLIIVLIALALTCAASYWYPGSITEVLRTPVTALLGAPGRLNVTLLEVSSNPAPVRAASRRLLQPFGMVQLIRIFPPTSTVSEPRKPEVPAPPGN